MSDKLSWTTRTAPPPRFARGEAHPFLADGDDEIEADFPKSRVYAKLLKPPILERYQTIKARLARIIRQGQA
jgi:hypothetical protein